MAESLVELPIGESILRFYESPFQDRPDLPWVALRDLVTCWSRLPHFIEEVCREVPRNPQLTMLREIETATGPVHILPFVVAKDIIRDFVLLGAPPESIEAFGVALSYAVKELAQRRGVGMLSFAPTILMINTKGLDYYAPQGVPAPNAPTTHVAQ